MKQGNPIEAAVSAFDTVQTHLQAARDTRRHLGQSLGHGRAFWKRGPTLVDRIESIGNLFLSSVAMARRITPTAEAASKTMKTMLVLRRSAMRNR